MPSDKFKFSAKNGVVAPVIKKLYNSHKKFLGKTSTPVKIESKAKEIARPKQNSPKLTAGATEETHVYENVSFASTTSEKTTSFSEEVFAGVNLSLSSLNMDAEASFSNSTNCIDTRSDTSYPALSSDCSTLTNYEESETSLSSVSCATPTSDLIENRRDNLKIFVQNHPDPDADNITIVEVDDVKEKLKTAIDNFDKILNEYTPTSKPPHSKPKLQKSKTCSIIESKCILKKALSDSSSAQMSFNSLNLTQITTKSLCRLDQDLGATYSEINYKNLVETQKFLSEIDFWKVPDAKRKELKQQVKDEVPDKEVKSKILQGSEDIPQIKVKDVVKRLNSLSGDEDKKSNSAKRVPNKQYTKTANKVLTRKKSDGKERNHQKSSSAKPPLQKSLSNERKSTQKTNKPEKPPVAKPRDTKKDPNKEITISSPKIEAKKSKDFVKSSEIRPSLIPRAVSCYDISGLSKRPPASKIPVKTNLNKTFPSTPSNLNQFLDSTMRCTTIKYEEKCQSVQNLAAKINQNENKFGPSQKRLVSVDLERTVSCQNLNGLSRNVKDDIKYNSGEPARNLDQNVKSGEESVARAIRKGKKTSSDIKIDTQKDAGVGKLDRNEDSDKNIVGKGKITSYQSSSIKDENQDISKNQIENQDCPKLKKDVPETKRKLTRNLTYNRNTVTTTASKLKVEIVTDEERNIVRQFLEELRKDESTTEPDRRNQKGKEVKNKSSDKLELAKKGDTFGVKKLSMEAKFCELESPKKRYNTNPMSTLRKNVLKRTDTYSKNQRIKEFQAIERIEQSLKTAKEFSVDASFLSCENLNNNPSLKANCVLNVEDTFALTKIAEADVRDDEKVFKILPKLSVDEMDFSKGVCAEKHKDYLSDDNSDDSGNISNELELEYEDVSSVTRSRTTFSSSESFASKNSDTKSDDKIFFRSGVLTQLESQRDEKLAGMVISLQAHCRGYLARKKLSQRKLQDLAVRCIQRNVRKFLLVRDWPWWRLLVRVTPLLNVHRTEEELKLKTEELEVLKTKLEKLESERISLKHQNDKLEAKVRRF
ncbi:hypothetical protein Trydic_g2342 [Trypoxylus dichotomus]